MIIDNYRTFTNVKHWALGSEANTAKKDKNKAVVKASDELITAGRETRAVVKMQSWLRGYVCKFVLFVVCVEHVSFVPSLCADVGCLLGLL